MLELQLCQNWGFGCMVHETKIRVRVWGLRQLWQASMHVGIAALPKLWFMIYGLWVQVRV